MSQRIEKAFTILELLVIASVLATLIGITIPRFKALSQNGNRLKAIKELNVLKSAVETYRTFDSSHSFPSSTTTLQASYLVNSTPKVLTSILYDPFGATPTTEYNYLCSSNRKYYVIWSVGLPGQNQPTAISNTGSISY